ncbi:MAG: intermembrane transport protein PqiB [Pseudomonadales bacterium]|nr:intermembrane transport protein PqiB [Pseudomonadales bacterium]
MTSDADYTEARIRSGRRLSVIWLVPFIALVIGIWMIYVNWASQGPIIQIIFESGEGIEAGKTKVRMKNVEIGEVLELQLSKDAEHVLLSARIEKNAARLLRTDSKFWVVRPRIGTGGVSGLGTLLSGAYIELSPGSENRRARVFEGLDAPPVTPLGTPGLHVTLDSDTNRSLNEGDPILFHGMQVGTIEYVHFNTKQRRNYYDAFIAAPFDSLITDNTRFWFISGISASISADGVSLEMASLATIIGGGVSFDVPQGLPRGDRVTKRAFFTIYPRKNAIDEKYYEYSLPFVILFENSIRGLSPGAPVEYRGIKIGHVIRTDIDYPEITNLLDPGSKIPVLIEITPARLGFEDSEIVLPKVVSRIDALIASGLRAGLATGNILTGSKYIELQYHSGTVGTGQIFADYTVIPSIDGQIGLLLDSLGTTLNTVNKLPLDEIVGSANSVLEEVAETLVVLRKSAAELEQILADPASQELIVTLNATLKKFELLAIDFSEGSTTQQELERSLNALGHTLRELEPVLKNLRHKPNSLIFGRLPGEDLEPKGVRE